MFRESGAGRVPVEESGEPGAPESIHLFKLGSQGETRNGDWEWSDEIKIVCPFILYKKLGPAPGHVAATRLYLFFYSMLPQVPIYSVQPQTAAMDSKEDISNNTVEFADSKPPTEPVQDEAWLAAEKSLVRKLDLTLMPMVWILYLFNYLDRNNIAYARLISHNPLHKHMLT